MYSFITSYVGSKKSYIKHLQEYSGYKFYELFAGSAVLSTNLATNAVLNDLDPYVCKILKNFDQLIVPEVFTQEDYFKVRSTPDWWQYTYCLQKMSFSGVFRYSKNGYNVPAKPNVKELRLREEYLLSLERWKQLKPTVINGNYLDINIDDMKGCVIIVDPPYEDSQASYNKKFFDYAVYWDYVSQVCKVAYAVLVFDRKKNLCGQNIPQVIDRNMRVNGKRAGDVESLAIHKNGEWLKQFPSITDQ